MRLITLLLAAMLALGSATARPSHVTPAPYHSLTRIFADFADETATTPDAQRVALFKARFAPLFPGFYEPANGETPAQFDASVAKALRNFPALRPRYEQAERAFPTAYAAGIAHFRRQFPRFKPLLPVWFVHSLNRMDGGTRILHGKTVMIFGADVIAVIHDNATIGPFLDHELFHVENGQWFKDCQPDTTIWCSLWQEGGATYAASVMNPGASDHRLMLDMPKPIRPAVDASWRNALCLLSGDLDKGDEATYAGYFYGGDRHQAFPARWGYYVGYRMMQRLGTRYSLAQIDHFDNAAAHKLVTQELSAMVQEMGGCGG